MSIVATTKDPLTFISSTLSCLLSEATPTNWLGFLIHFLHLCLLHTQAQCQDLRKRKNLELQILSEPVRAWEGESMKSLGSVAYMSQVHMRTGSSEVRDSGASAVVHILHIPPYTANISSSLSLLGSFLSFFTVTTMNVCLLH